MRSYMDKTYAAVGNCLLSYIGKDTVLNIPDHFADIPVQIIGDGCFMESRELQQAVIPRSIRKIGEKAFCGCDRLYRLYLPGTVEEIHLTAFAGCKKLIDLIFYDLPVSVDSYNALKQNCIQVGRGLFLAPFFPDFPIVKHALSATSTSASNLVPLGIDRLFVAQNLEETMGETSLRRNLERYEFAGREGLLTEETSFESLLTAPDARFALDPFSEQKNDEFIRLEKYPTIQRTAVFSFDDLETKGRGETRWIRATVKLGYFFWQSQVPLRMEGRQYYLYRRHYLTSDGQQLQYVRQDTAIFSDEGLVRNRKEAQTVYAKYKLLSIL